MGTLRLVVLHPHTSQQAPPAPDGRPEVVLLGDWSQEETQTTNRCGVAVALAQPCGAVQAMFPSALLPRGAQLETLSTIVTLLKPSLPNA